MSSHPARGIMGTLGDKLKGKKVVLCVSGCALAYQSADIASQLMGHGSEVRAVMSPMAQKIIHPNLLERFTCNPVVTEITGKLEHLALTTGSGKADLVCVAPASSNTISKIALAIGDTPVTTVALAALGSKIPFVILPAMHEYLFRNPILTENVEKLKKIGVEFVGPRVEEGKFKIATCSEVVQTIIRKLK